MKGGVLFPDEKVIEELKKKHPSSRDPIESVLLEESDGKVDAGYWEVVDSAFVGWVSKNLRGAHGPSGTPGSAWRAWCRGYKGASSDLCAAVANLVRKMATRQMDAEVLAPLIACRLVALDKDGKGGVRPVGIGESLRRLISKIVARRVKEDVIKAAGALQVCSGQAAGIEAAVHAARSIWEDEETDCIILVDARNAFNELNRKAALHNVGRICPGVAGFLRNVYAVPALLRLSNGEVILSEEGTTQGDPLAMQMFALGISPLIKQLEGLGGRQVWYADDSQNGGKARAVRAWFDRLKETGPGYGYFVNDDKTYVICRGGEAGRARCMEAFRGSGISDNNFLAEDGCRAGGRRDLGAAIGSDEFCTQFMKAKIEKWVTELECLSELAEIKPQEGLAILTHGISHRWRFLMRTMEGAEKEMGPLENALKERFLPALRQRPCDDFERRLQSLPARMAGLGVFDPVEEAATQFKNSVEFAQPHVDALLRQDSEWRADRSREVKLRARFHREAEKKNKAKMEALRDSDSCPDILRWRMEESVGKNSTWVSALPLRSANWALGKRFFRTCLDKREGKEPLGLEKVCDGCGKDFSSSHGVDCKKGGLVRARHEHGVDFVCEESAAAFNGVTTKFRLTEVTGEKFQYKTAKTGDEAVPDVMVPGLYDRRRAAYLDFEVTNTDSSTARSRGSPAAHLKLEGQKKRRFYAERLDTIDHADFGEMVVSHMGACGRGAEDWVKRVAAEQCSSAQEMSVRVNAVRVGLQFAVLRGMCECLWGSRMRRWKNGTTSAAVADPEVLLIEAGLGGLSNE